MATKTKQRRGLSTSGIAIIVLSILLLSSIVIGVTLAYFTGDDNVAGNITLGDPVTISITQGGSSVSSLIFDDKALPGSVYDQAIGVQAPAATTDALIRAKLTISEGDGTTTNVEATTASTWVKGTDDYYYYNGVLSSNDNVDFITSVTIPTTLTNEHANKTYTIDVIVEAIQQANNAANAVWTTAPSDWINTYSPVVARTLSLDNQNTYNYDNNYMNENYQYSTNQYNNQSNYSET